MHHEQDGEDISISIFSALAPSNSMGRGPLLVPFSFDHRLLVPAMAVCLYASHRLDDPYDDPVQRVCPFHKDPGLAKDSVSLPAYQHPPSTKRSFR